MNQTTDNPVVSPLTNEAGYDPIEDRLRASVRATIEAMFEEELAEFLGRLRYDRDGGRAKGYRHGHRDRQLTGTFGTETVRVPRGPSTRRNGRSRLSYLMAPRLRPLLTPPNDGNQKENRLDLRVALKKGHVRAYGAMPSQVAQCRAITRQQMQGCTVF